MAFGLSRRIRTPLGSEGGRTVTQLEDQETLSGRKSLRLKLLLSSFSFCRPSIVRRYFSTPRIFPVLSDDSVASFLPMTDCISRSSSALGSVLRFSLPFSVFSSGSLRREPSLRLSERLFLREMALLECCLPLRLRRSILSRCQWVRSISRLVTLRLLSRESTLWERARAGERWFWVMRSQVMFSRRARGSSAGSSSSSSSGSVRLGKRQWRLCSDRRQRILISIMVFILMRSSLRVSSSLRVQLLISFISRLCRTARSFITSDCLRFSINNYITHPPPFPLPSSPSSSLPLSPSPPFPPPSPVIISIVIMEMEEEPTLPCENCQKMCAASKLDLHEAQCRRNIRKCKFCGLMVDINEEPTHYDLLHAPQPCPHCRTPLEPPLLAPHLAACPLRPLPCAYCLNPFPANDLPKHQETCGSRTKLCELCLKYVKLSAEKEHLGKCRGAEVRRNESQEERRGQANRVVRERMNSNDHMRREAGVAVSPRGGGKTTGKVVEAEMIRQLVDPVPIAVRVAQQREKERRGRGQ